MTAVDGNFDIDNLTGDFYLREFGAWVLKGNIGRAGAGSGGPSPTQLGLYIDLDTANVYFGGALVGPIAGGGGGVGPPGPQGIPGLGIPGDDGDDGEDAPIIPGPQGIPGTPGSDGAPGIGLMGIPGDDGDDGEDAPIIPGPQGIQGTQGTQGIQGLQGFVIPGNDGNDGEDAPIIPGPQGIPGQQGTQGIQGLQGFVIPGNDGNDGEDAPTIPGTQGVQGIQGIQGTQGLMGPPGDDGNDGEQSYIPGPPAVVSAGSVVNSAFAEVATYSTTTAVIPVDDTIPQNTEGTQIISVSITPKNTSNKLRVRFSMVGAPAAADNIAIALFVNSTANALAAHYSSTSAGFSQLLILEHEFVPGSTSTQTLAVRAGTASGTTLGINGTSSARIFGGVSVVALCVEEIAA